MPAGKTSESDTVWIAHRGYCQGHLENTRSSFSAAVEKGFHCLETDLRADRDGYLILSHDPDLSRVGGPSEPVSRMRHDSLERVRLANGESPLFFDEFVKLYDGMLWVFDIKPETGYKVVSGLADWLRRTGSEAWFFSKTWFLFWSVEQEQIFRKMFPEARLFAREPECWKAGLWALSRLPGRSIIRPGVAYALPEKLWGLRLFRREIISRYHGAGAQVIAYLPSTGRMAGEAVQARVDFVLTDYENSCQMP